MIVKFIYASREAYRRESCGLAEKFKGTTMTVVEHHEEPVDVSVADYMLDSVGTVTVAGVASIPRAHAGEFLVEDRGGHYRVFRSFAGFTVEAGAPPEAEPPAPKYPVEVFANGERLHVDLDVDPVGDFYDDDYRGDKQREAVREGIRSAVAALYPGTITVALPGELPEG